MADGLFISRFHGSGIRLDVAKDLLQPALDLALNRADDRVTSGMKGNADPYGCMPNGTGTRILRSGQRDMAC